MDFGISLPASLEADRQAKLAEALGFAYIGFFDSPALEAEIWITVYSAIRATQRIKVGTQVLVPHLRHPMAQAAAIATIEHVSPGRLFVGVGTGFTGCKAMGRRALPWAQVSQAVTQIKALLLGEDVSIEDGVTRMLHPPEFAPKRPIRVPFLIAANGPKGVKIAREVGDGLIYGGFSANTPQGFATLELGMPGILLDDGESPNSDRVLDAAKQGFAMQYHLAYEGYFNPPILVEHLPYGGDWLDTLQKIPVETRHLELHANHMAGVNPHDGSFIARHPDALADFAAANAMRAANLREGAKELAALGATRIAYAVRFADWEADMRRYARALELSPS